MASIEDIAKEAKVSKMTVSRVLNGNAEYIRPTFSKRAERIREIAARLGYRPNSAARSMKTGKHGCISLLTSSVPWFSTFSGQFLFSLQHALQELDSNLLLNMLPSEEKRAGELLPRIFRENCVDGVLVGITHQMPAWLEQLIRSLGVPFIWLNSKHEADCVYHDDFGAAYGIATRLVKAGHTRIAYVDYAIPEDNKTAWHFSVVDRMDGFKKAIADAGLEPFILRPKTSLPIEKRLDCSCERLFDGFKPTAIVSYDMPFTGRPILYAALKRGIKIPDDLSFVAFTPAWPPIEGDLKLSAFMHRSDFGEVAARCLHDKIGSKNAPLKPVVLPFEFMEGNTVSWMRSGSLEH